MKLTKKKIALMLVFCLLLACMNAASAAGGERRKGNGLPNGLKNGLVAGEKKESGSSRPGVLKDGLRNGLVDGDKHDADAERTGSLPGGLKNGLVDGEKNDAASGRSDGLPNGLQDGLRNGLVGGDRKDALSDDRMNMYANSDFIEKEQPELDEETKRLIALCQSDPTEENYENLRHAVIENYNAVLARKKAKLDELREETAGKPGGAALVAEMEQIVQEMYDTYWDRIDSTMLRFTDTRLLQWRTASASEHEYIPVMGAGESVYIKRTPVTNEEYAEFIQATGASAPSNWVGGTYPDGEGDYPVNYISYGDAVAYCAWLTETDGANSYRLPDESEWELAAGHMPKDADFNCGVNDGRTSVEQYADVTHGAHGAVDFWGNVWEWTSTERAGSDETTELGVKGGSWASDRTDCRTEYRDEGRDSSMGYEDVGFRVVQIVGGTAAE